MSEQVLRGGNVMERSRTRTLTQIAMLGAVAGVLMNFEFPIPFLAPSFYQLDFSEIPVLIGSFAMGPLAGVVIELVKILVHLPFPPYQKQKTCCRGNGCRNSSYNCGRLSDERFCTSPGIWKSFWNACGGIY